MRLINMIINSQNKNNYQFTKQLTIHNSQLTIHKTKIIIDDKEKVADIIK